MTKTQRNLVQTLLARHATRLDDADHQFLLDLRAWHVRSVLSIEQRKRLRDVAAKHGE